MSQPDNKMHTLKGSAARFVFAGGINTLVTAIALTILATVIHPAAAYTIVFSAGIALSAWLASNFVYGVRFTRTGILLYVSLYLLVYLIGLGALWVAQVGGLPPWASGGVVLITAPLNFAGGRIIASMIASSRAMEDGRRQE